MQVVPMSRQSGVLEWCEGTVPLGDYLVEAHCRYRPKVSFILLFQTNIIYANMVSPNLCFHRFIYVKSSNDDFRKVY